MDFDFMTSVSIIVQAHDGVEDLLRGIGDSPLHTQYNVLGLRGSVGDFNR